MIKIVLSILTFASSFFLTLLFWGLAEDSSKRVLTALFGSLTAVSTFKGGLLCTSK